MPSVERLTTLRKEVDLAASHLAIVAIHMSGALSVRLDVPATLRGHAGRSRNAEEAGSGLNTTGAAAHVADRRG